MTEVHGKKRPRAKKNQGLLTNDTQTDRNILVLITSLEFNGYQQYKILKEEGKKKRIIFFRRGWWEHYLPIDLL